jgi:hypothetical protein
MLRDRMTMEPSLNQYVGCCLMLGGSVVMLVDKLALLFVVRHDDQYVQTAANETGMSVSNTRRPEVMFVKFLMGSGVVAHDLNLASSDESRFLTSLALV